MRDELLGTILEKIKLLLVIEITEKLSRMKVDEKKDRIRIVYEFEFKDGEIRDAIEIRQRRPWAK